MEGRGLSKLRTFIAIDLPVATKEEIARAIESLKKESLPWIPDKRIVWENPQKFHITLVFLGHIPREKMEIAAKAVHEATRNFPEFTLTGGSLSYFLKDKRSPDSIIYLNVLDPERNLRTLYKALFKLLTGAGFYPPERISAHITIGRLKGKRLRANERKRILSAVFDIDIKPIHPFLVDSLNIYESIPSGDSMRYHLLKNFPLGK